MAQKLRSLSFNSDAQARRPTWPLGILTAPANT
jgi:hypothetical protein